MNCSADARYIDEASRLADEAGWHPPTELSADGARALAWALKDLCYASWSSDPQRAVRAADGLRRLRDTVPAACAGEARPEIDALVAWTGGIAHLIHGDMEIAASSFDAAAAAFGGLAQPHHAALTQVPKIMALTMLGRHDDAARCAQAAQRALLEQGDLHAASKVSLNLGNLHLHGDRYAEAAPQFREAAVLFARSGDHEHSVMADIGAADALAALGDLREAARMYARARMRAAARGFPVLQAMVEESVALLELAQGHYREALAGLEWARQNYAALEMPQHLAIAEKQLAVAYLELRLLPESLAGLDAALERFGALGMQVDRAWALVQRGRALALSGQRTAAEATLAESAALFATLDNTIGEAAVALARAELALGGDDGHQALALAREAVRGFGRAGLVQRQLRAECVCAQALLHTGEVEAARMLFDATLDAAKSHQLLPVQLRCLTGRAMTARAAGDSATARRHLEAAVELFEDQRRSLPGDEIRSAFQSDHLLPFEELLRLELDLHDSGGRNAIDVLAQLDRFRARTLADRLGAVASADGEAERTGRGDEGDSRDDRPPDPDAEPVAQQAGTQAGTQEVATQEATTQELRTRLAWLYRRLQRLHDEAGASAALSAELRQTERQLLERARRTRLAAAAGAAAPVHASAEFDPRSLQRRLAPGDALVEYGVIDDELFACVLSHEGVQVRRRLASWRQVQGAVRAARFQLETLRHGEARLMHHLSALATRVRSHLQHLHTLLWQPLVPLLGGCERVLVVPHAQLGSIPFAALHDGQCCLLERHQVAFAPSARIALRCLARKRRAIQTVLALGESTRLPHAAHEAHAVAGMLPQGRAFVGDEATLENLRAHAGDADVIHLACHAQFRADNPVFSALHLSDGVLTAEAIESMRLPGAVIVLSACETALHEQGGGDEMFGLTRAFLVAGAARVVASLWSVDDATTAELMSDFYGGLRRGQPPAAALRLAQLAARQRREHPFHWASFTVIGGW